MIFSKGGANIWPMATLNYHVIRTEYTAVKMANLDVGRVVISPRDHVVAVMVKSRE